MDMFTIYIIVWLTLTAFSVYFAAADTNIQDYERADVIKGACMVAFAWPFLLIAAIVVGPFYGLYALGVYRRKKKSAKEAD